MNWNAISSALGLKSKFSFFKKVIYSVIFRLVRYPCFQEPLTEQQPFLISVAQT